MKRLDLIEQLGKVQENIEIVEGQVNRKEKDSTFYKFFGHGSKHFQHDREIRIKALGYWMRKFNRITQQLIYKN
jgi:hypothetical protein